MKAHIEILGQEFLVDFDFKMTSAGYPETGPSFSSPGEPAEAPEFDITVIELDFAKRHADVPQPEMPEWLKDTITTYLLEDDRTFNAMCNAAHDSDIDPDYERDIAIENREQRFRDLGDDL